jgi:hypothetical protein
MFVKEMLVAEAIKLHPDAIIVFAAFHMSSYSKHVISETETIEQTCKGYGINTEIVVDSLNHLFKGD